MSKQTDAQRIAALERKMADQKRELDALKAAQAPPAPPAFKPMSTAEHIDQMHRAAEARANKFQFRPEILREMVKACGTADLADLVHASRRPQGPRAGGIPSSQTLSGVHAGGGARIPPGSGTGWRDAAELRPPPGINYVDRLVDEQDRRDRADLAERLAKQSSGR
jgi:hypothetical protein